ncbi:MAG: DUF1549 domain-containing protein [Zavarzinella sp.]
MRICTLSVVLFCISGFSPAWGDTLSKQIDLEILKNARQQPVAPVADDAEFVRRIYLDLIGSIPSVQLTTDFLANKDPNKRTSLIDQLLASKQFTHHLSEQLHILLMERLGENPLWQEYLSDATTKNKPWDQMVREMLQGSNVEGAPKGASFFLSKRLENYGQNPVDYPALTRDIGRLFCGVDLQCAECHDHLFVKEYKQRDFQGLYAFVQHAYLVDATTAQVGEKLPGSKVAFSSVFKKLPLETGPALPGKPELDLPMFPKGEEYIVAPDRKTKSPGKLKISYLQQLGETVAGVGNDRLASNIANRIWHMLMGKGLVEPLDMFHAENPPSHPELMKLLTSELIAHRYDLKWLIREVVRSESYQRSSKLAESSTYAYGRGLEKRMSAEQFSRSLGIALGKPFTKAETDRLLKTFANAPREPEVEIAPSLKGVLFLRNDPLIHERLNPTPETLVGQIATMKNDEIPDRLMLQVLTRKASAAEKAKIVAYLSDPATRQQRLPHLVWAVISSTEFTINH